MANIKRKKWLRIVMSVAILTCLYFIGITRNSNKFQIDKKATLPENTVDASSAEEGTLTNDDPWTEMNKIAERYLNNNLLSLSGNIKLYDYESSKLIEEQKFSYSKSAKFWLYTLGSIETAANDKYTVAVDHSENVVAVSKTRNLSASIQAFDIEKLKKLLSDNEASARVLQNGNQKILVVNNIIYEDIANYKIYYDPDTYRVSKIIMEMSTTDDFNPDDSDADSAKSAGENKTENDEVSDEAETNTQSQQMDSLTENAIPGIQFNDYTVEINYVQEKQLPPTANDPVKKYVTIKDKMIMLTDQFKNYELINQAQ